VNTQLERIFPKLAVHTSAGLGVRVFTDLIRMREEERREQPQREVQ
jgi:hypothetical protein